jgi:hypothetical protein
MAFYYTSFDRYNEAGLDSYEFGTPDEIVNQYAANIIGNKFVVPMNGAPITLKNSYTRDEIDKFGPMDSSMFYLTESNIVYGVSKPSIHNLRVHPFKWGENKLMMAISLTYNVNNYVRTDDFILTYSFVNGKFVADGDLALPAIVYTKKYSKINMPNVTGFQAIIVKFD